MNVNSVKFEYAAGTSAQLPKPSKPEVIFSGRSNVGKSSLINKMVNRKSLARVSSKPGKTGTINFYSIDDFYIVDLPGYGYAKVSQSEKKRWANLVEGYFNQDRKFCLIIQILDIRHNPSNDDMQMINFLCETKLPFIIVLTKKDKIKKAQVINRLTEINNDLADFSNIYLLTFSALSGEGVEEVQSAIDRRLDEFRRTEITEK